MKDIDCLSTTSKGKNDLQVLSYLRKNGAKSRVDIAKELKLTKAAITLVTNNMLIKKIILERGEQTPDSQKPSRGRRKILIDINENYKLVFGVVIKKDFVFIGLSNLKGQILDKTKFPIRDKSYRELLELIVSIVSKMMKNNCIADENLLALGLCLGRDCSPLLEGNTLQEKLNRVKKDLGHAVSIKLVSDKLMHGAILAQKLFLPVSYRESMVILRYNEDAPDSGMLLNARLYDGKNSNAGCFCELINNPEFTTEDGFDNRIAKAASLCSWVFDPEKLLVFGDFFEDETKLEQINRLIKGVNPKLLPLERAFICEDNIFLTASAIAVETYFYDSKKL